MADRGTTRTISARGGAGSSAPLWDDSPDVSPGRGSASSTDGSAVLVDCDTCAVRGPGCDDCVMTVLLGMPAPPLRIGVDQVAALGVLARSGLVPPLRHDRVY